MKTIFVTGAASGIGKSIAESMAKDGNEVIISDLNLDGAQALSESLNAEGFTTKAYALDVGNQEAIDQAGKDFPNVDILINNAGIQYVAKLENFPADRWRLINNILLVGPAMLTRAFLVGMKARNFGRIINVGSIHGLVASPYKTAYVAAKHGLLGFSKVVALETAEFDITINTICPSYVKTPC